MISMHSKFIGVFAINTRKKYSQGTTKDVDVISKKRPGNDTIANMKLVINATSPSTTNQLRMWIHRGSPD